MRSCLRVFSVLVVLSLSLVLFSGCDSLKKEAGSFEVNFIWPADGSPDFSDESKSYYAWAILEEWEDGDSSSSKTLSVTTATLFGSDGSVSLDLSGLTYGSNRVIKVEIRNTDNDKDHVLYYGYSDPFEFSIGSNTVVDIRMELTSAPGSSPTGEQDDSAFSIAIHNSEGSEVQKVRLPEVVVQLKAVGADTVIISNALSLLEGAAAGTAGVSTYKVSELDSTVENQYTIPWNINDGLDEVKLAGTDRTVYAKIINADGYESRPDSADVKMDAIAPSVDVLIDPINAKLNDNVKVRLTFSEAVTDPTIDWDGLTFTRSVANEGDNIIFIYEHTVTTDDEEKSDYTFVITSVLDEVGNSLEGYEVADKLSIDKSNPSFDGDAVVSVTDNKPKIKIGDTVTVSFTSSEALSVNPEVKINDISAAIDTDNSEGNSYVYSYTLKDGDIDGTKTISIYMKDLAGNSDTVSLDDKVIFDLTAPEVLNPVIENQSAINGDTITVRFIFSEEVEDVTFSYDGLGLECEADGDDSKKWTCEHLVVQTDEDRDYLVTMTANDLAGNELGTYAFGTISVDRSLPVIEYTVSVTDDKPKLKAGDEITIDFSVDEPVGSGPIIKIGTETISGLIPTDTTDGIYTYHYVHPVDTTTGGGQAISDGNKDIFIELADMAGNAINPHLDSVIYDNSTPQMLTKGCEPEFAKIGTAVEVAVSFNESVASGVTVYALLDGDPSKRIDFINSDPAGDDQSFRFSHTVENVNEEGRYTVKIDAIDTAGNTIDSAGNTIGESEIDKTPPVVSDLEIDIDPDVPIKAGTPFKINFSVNEPIKEGSLLEIGKFQVSLMDECTSTPSDPTVAPAAFECTHTVNATAEEGDGTKAVAAAAVDLAGNLTRKVLDKEVNYDTTAATIINATAFPGNFKESDLLKVEIGFNEVVETVVFHGDGLSFNDCTTDTEKQHYICTYTVLGTDDNREYSFTADITDTAGNLIEGLSVVSAVIDTTLPVISNQSVVTSTGNDPIGSGATVTTSFTVSEEPLSDPVLRIGTFSVTVSETTEGSLTYEYTKTVESGDSDGLKNITVELQDKAGNAVEGTLGTVTFDTIDPDIVNPIVTPAGTPGLAGLDSTVEVRFSLSEDVETIVFNGNGLTFTENSVDNNYTYSYTVASDALEQTYTFSVDLTDVAGNTNSVNLQPVQIDRTAPSISTYAVSATNIILGAPYTITLEFSEELKTVPAILVGSTDISSDCTKDTSVPSVEKWVCTHTAESSEGDGVKQINVQMTDLAGNSASTLLKDGSDVAVTIEYDTTSPEIVNPVIAPEKANMDSTIDVRFSFTEEVNNVVIDWGALDGKFTRDADNIGNKKLFIYKHTVDGADSNGVYPISITAAEDNAGNSISGTILIGSVEIDNTAPVISNEAVTVVGESDLFVSTGDTVQIKFDTAEEIADYKVRIGLNLVETCSVVDNGGGSSTYTCTHSDPATIGDGIKDVTAELKDTAGNSETHNLGTQLTYDMTAPQISNKIILPQKANESTTSVEVKFGFNENVKLTTLDDSSLGLGGAECTVDGAYANSFICTHTFVAGSYNDEYAIAVTVEDEAGNALTAEAIGTLTVDRIIPTISGESVAPTNVKKDEEIVIDFTASEELEGDPIVKIGAKQLSTCGGAITTSCCENTGGNAYRCTHPANVDNDEGEGDKLITVSIMDPAGNPNSLTFAQSINYDTVTPQILNPTVTPETSNSQTPSIDVRFSFPEDVENVTCTGAKTDGEAVAPASLTFTCAADPDDGSNKKTFKCSYDVASAAWKIGTYALSANAKDLADNWVDPAGRDVGTAVVDKEIPDITVFTVDKTNVALGEAFVIDLSFSEELNETPVVLVGSQNITSECVENSITNYTCTHTTLVAEGDGVKQINVQMTDIALNTRSKVLKDLSDDYVTIEYDVTPPSVINPIIAPSVANTDTTIDVRVSFTEDLASAPTINWGVLDGLFTLDAVNSTDKLYIYTYKVDGSAPEGGPYTVTVTYAEDSVGNEMLEDEIVGTITIDNSAPAISDTTVTVLTSGTPQSDTLVNEDDDIKVEFTVVEEISDYKVRVGIMPFSGCTEEDLGGDSTKYTCEYDNPQKSDGEGLKDVTVELKDAAGNSETYAIGNVTYDMTDPQLSSNIILPEKVNKSTEKVQVKFSFAEDVTLTATTAEAITLTGAECVVDGSFKKDFICEYTFESSNTDVIDYAVTASVEDRAGNETNSEAIGTIVVDRELPTLSAQDVDPVAVKGLEDFTVTFTISEDLLSEPIVKVGTKQLTGCTNTDKDYSCTHTANVDGDEADGDKAVSVNMVDMAGNNAIVTLTKSINYDATVPIVLNPVIIPEAMASLFDDTIQVRFSFSEVVKGLADASFVFTTTVDSGDSISFDKTDCSTSNDQSFTCEYTPGAIVGEYSFSVSASDIAGNILTDYAIGSLAVDRVAPTASWIEAPGVPEYVKNGDTTLTFTLTSSEAVKTGVDPVVTIGNNEASTTCSATDGAVRETFSCSFADLSSVSDGTKNLTASFTDQFENSVTTVTSIWPITFDTVVPSVISKSIAPAVANLADSSVDVNFIFSEPVDGFDTGNDAHVVVTNVSGTTNLPARACSNASGDSKTYSCTFDITGRADMDTVYSFAVVVADEVGNPATISIGNIVVDNIKPVLSNKVVPTKIIDTDTEAVVSFTISEPSGTTTPKAKIGSGTEVTCTNTSGNNYECTFDQTYINTVPGGTQSVFVTLEDEAENQISESIGGILFDTAPPTVLTYSVSPAVSNVERNLVTLTFSFSEKVENVTVGKPASFPVPVCSDNGGDQQNYTCTFNLSALGATDSGFSFTVTADDINGNPMASAAPIGSVTVDNVMPAITVDPTVTDDLINASEVAAGFTTSFTESTADTIDTVSVKLGAETGVTVNCTGSYSCAFSDLGAVTDGTKDLIVELTDNAGNTKAFTYSDKVEFETTAPTLIPKSIVPSIANEDTEQIVVSFAFSEPISSWDDSFVAVSTTTTPNMVDDSYSCVRDGQDVTCTFDISCSGECTEYNGSYDFEVSGITDTAGNPMVLTSAGTATIDQSSPTLVIDSVTPTTVNEDTTTITVVITAGEALDTDPELRLGTETGVTITRTDLTGTTYTYEITNLSAITSDGNKTLFVDMTDNQGNTKTISYAQPIVVDRTDATNMNDMMIPDEANANTNTATLKFSFSEPMVNVDASDIVATGTPALPACTLSTTDDQNFSCEYDISAGTYNNIDETYSFKIISTGGITDENGNPLPADINLTSTLHIDSTAPVVTWDATTPAAPVLVNSINEGNSPVLTVKFATSEAVSGDQTTVWIGGEESMNCTTTASGTSFTCEFTDISGVIDGSDKTISVEGSDIAGNPFSDSSATTVTFDRVLPVVVTSNLAPSEVNRDTTEISLSIGFSEPVFNFSGADITGANNFNCSSSDDVNYTCTYDVTANNPADGTHTLTIAAGALFRDDSFNRFGPEQTLGSVGIDRTDPAVTFGTVSPAVVVNETHNTLTTEFTITEANLDSYIVKLGTTDAVPTCSNTGSDYSCEFALDKATDGIPDGNHTISVIVTDTFGNSITTNNGPSKDFDRTDPTIISGTVAPQVLYGINKIITLNITMSEKVVNIENYMVFAFPWGELPAPTCTNPSGDQQSFECVYDTDGYSDIDGEHIFTIESVSDINGNTMDSDEEVGRMVIDKTYIEATFGTITPLNVNTDTAELSITFTLDEAPAYDPFVKVGNDEIRLSTPTTVDGLTYTYTTSDFSGILIDGEKSIVVTVYDTSGNLSYETSATKVNFDLTRPTVISSVFGPTVVSEFTTTLTLNLAFSEDMTGYTVSSTPSLSSYFNSCSDGVCTWTMPSTVTYIDNSYDFTITGTDLNGNTFESEPVSLGTVEIDRTLPIVEVSRVKVCSAGIAGINIATNNIFCTGGAANEMSSAKVGSTIAYLMKFERNNDATEYDDLTGRPVIWIGSEIKVGTPSLTYQDTEGDEYAFVYEYEVLGGETNGEKTISYIIEDTSGNLLNESDTLVANIDTIAPEVTSHGIAPILLNSIDDLATVALNFSEAVYIEKFNGLTDSSGKMEFRCLSDSEYDLYYECTYNMSADGDAPNDNTSGNGYELTIAAIDDAGNTVSLPMPEAPLGILIDTTLPVLNSSSVSETKVKGSTAFVVYFQVTELLDDSTDIIIGSERIDITVCGSSGTAPVNYTCNHTSPATGTNGTKSIILDGTDLNGNPIVDDLGTIEYDFFGPVVVSQIVQRDPDFASARNNTTKILELSASDPLTEEPVILTMTLFADEDVSESSGVTIVPVSGNAMTFDTITYDDNVVTCTKELDASMADGIYDFRLSWYDDLGNQSITDLEWKVDMDAAEPSLTALNTDQIIYKRKPWGTNANGGVANFSLTGNTYAVTSADIVQVFAYSVSGQYIGKGVVDEATGTFEISQLSGGDLAVVYLNPVNRSGAKIAMLDSGGDPVDVDATLKKVLNIEWTATMNNKIVGQLWPNPNQLNTRDYGVDHLMREEDTSLQEVGDGTHSTELIPPLKEITTTPLKIDRTNFALSYDSIRGELIVHGGENMDNTEQHFDYANTYIWNGKSWREVAIDEPGPSMRHDHKMVFDSNRRKQVLFGGTTGSNALFPHGDTWEWDGEDWLRVAETGPGDRSAYSMAYDPVNEVTVLFGGIYDPDVGGTVHYQDTWTWDGTSWTMLNPTTKPSSRYGHSMVYDESTGKILMFGGRDASYAYLQQTWEWDGANWHQITPALQPSGRTNFGFAYDTIRERAVLSGGLITGVRQQDTYEYYSGNWHLVTTTAAHGQLSGLGMVYDSNNERVLLYGGSISWTNESSALWQYDSDQDWTQIANYGPGSLNEAQMAYDASRNTMILFGGENSVTWQNDGTGWEVATSSGPDDRTGFDMVYDSSRNVIVLYGGSEGTTFYTDTWEWDGSSWTEISTADDPGGYSGNSMAYDSLNSRVIHHGGRDKDVNYTTDTHSYDGTDWTELIGTDPPEAYYHRMVFDTVRGKTVLFLSNSETWELTGSNWTQKSISDPEGDGEPGSDAPADPFRNFSMIYDSQRGVVVLYGGQDAYSNTKKDDIWEYNGISWRKRDISNAVGRAFSAMAYDSDNGYSVIHSGTDDYDSITDDTYTWDGGYNDRASQQLMVNFGAAYPGTGSEIYGIDVNWKAGGSGYRHDTEIDGALLSIWQNGGWLEAQSNGNDEVAPGEMNVAIDTQTVLSGMRLDSDDSLHFKVESLAPGGTEAHADPAVVKTEYAEVTVKYHVGEYGVPGGINEYLISATTATWENARTACVEWGGDLLIIDSLDEQNYVTSLEDYVVANYWIGVHDIPQDLQWRTVEGKHVWQGDSTGSAQNGAYTNWDTGRPTASSTDSCVMIYGASLWYNYSCTTSTRYICERKPEKKYHISTTTANWANARQECIDLGGDLVVVDGYVEQKSLETKLSSSTRFWLGFTDKDEEGIWSWVDGKHGWTGTANGYSYRYTNWATNQPNGGSGNYGEFYYITDYMWNDTSGTGLKYYVCEFGTEPMCYLNDDDCSSGDECCSEKCHAENSECVACIPDGGTSCSSGDDCCNDICNTADDECVTCLSNQERTCSDPGDCCDGSDSCYGGKCCRTAGSACSTSSQCCSTSQMCSSSECCTKPFSGCRLNSNCCSGSCTGSIGDKDCACRSATQVCTTDGQCCSGDCAGKVTKTCQLSGAGGFCNVSTDCESGECSTKTHICGK